MYLLVRVLHGLNKQNYSFRCSSRRYFGSSVAIDGDTIVAGARMKTPEAPMLVLHMYLLAQVLHGLSKRNTASDVAAYDNFGIAVAIDGDTVVVGAYVEDTGGIVQVLHMSLLALVLHGLNKHK